MVSVPVFKETSKSLRACGEFYPQHFPEWNSEESVSKPSFPVPFVSLCGFWLNFIIYLSSTTKYQLWYREKDIHKGKVTGEKRRIYLHPLGVQEEKLLITIQHPQGRNSLFSTCRALWVCLYPGFSLDSFREWKLLEHSEKKITQNNQPRVIYAHLFHSESS